MIPHNKINKNVDLNPLLTIKIKNNAGENNKIFILTETAKLKVN